jgi:hypothetical protein
MKKNEIKKLRLTRETLLGLENPEVQKAVRGGEGVFSSVSGTLQPTLNDSAGCCG